MPTWIGGTSTDFDLAGNWNTGSIPGPNDLVIFGTLAQRDCVMATGRTLRGVLLQEGFPGTFWWGGTLIVIPGGCDVDGGRMDPLSDAATLQVESPAFTVTIGEFCFPSQGMAHILVTGRVSLFQTAGDVMSIGSRITVEQSAEWINVCPDLTFAREAGVLVQSQGKAIMGGAADGSSHVIKKSTGQQTFAVADGELLVEIATDVTVQFPILVTSAQGFIHLREPNSGGVQPSLEVRGRTTDYPWSLIILAGSLTVGPEDTSLIGSPASGAGARTLTGENGFYVGAQAEVEFRTKTVTTRGDWKVDGFVTCNRCAWGSNGDVDFRDGGTLWCDLHNFNSFGSLVVSKANGRVYLDNAILRFEFTQGSTFLKGTLLTVISLTEAGGLIVGRPRMVQIVPNTERWAWELNDRTLVLRNLGRLVEVSPVTVMDTPETPPLGGRRLMGVGAVGDGGGG